MAGLLASTLVFTAAAMLLLAAHLRCARQHVDIWWDRLRGDRAFSYAVGPGEPARGMLVVVLAALWGLRLGAYLLWRNAGKGEDYRYQAMRRRHGERFGLASLRLVFGFQGLLMWLVSLPLQVAQTGGSTGGLGALDAIGTLLFCIGLGFESLGDLQLARFKADAGNAGRVMDRGLWRYTRHPNYFGDCVAWWGLWLIACGAPGGVYTIASPLLMTYLLVRVSGVALLERARQAQAGLRGPTSRAPALLPASAAHAGAPRETRGAKSVASGSPVPLRSVREISTAAPRRLRSSWTASEPRRASAT